MTAPEQPEHRRGQWGRHGGRPPGWPGGEQAPPAGPPWRHAPLRFRRRLLVAGLVFFLFVTAMGALGAHFWRGNWQSNPAGPDGRRPRGGPFPRVVVVIGLAALAGTRPPYPRLPRPVGDPPAAAHPPA